jgi:hypothetical protein
MPSRQILQWRNLDWSKNMKRISVLAVLIAGSVASHLAWGCKTTAVNVAISPTYSYNGSAAIPAMIYPDSGEAYVNGVNGVSAIINTSCTDDLILDLTNSTRRVGFSFQNAISTNSYYPDFDPNSFYANGAYLVVNNLMYNYNSTAWYQFTTSAELEFTSPGTKNQDYVCFANRSANIFDACAVINQPLATSLVVVTHSPANVATGAVETWTITPDNTNMNLPGSPAATQVGALAVPLSKNTRDNAGQFSMPFQFTVTRK